MSHALIHAYAAQDVGALRALGAPALACAAFELHWSGDLAGAEDACRQALEGTPRMAPEYASLVDAECILVEVKMGRGLRRLAPDSALNELATLVWWYARFSHFFWVDHREAWRSLGRLALLSLRTPQAGTLMTALFLMGHLLAIAGFRRLGFALCRVIHAHWFERRARLLHAPTRFSEAIVFAAFPYTALVSGKLARLDSIIGRCQRRLAARDPYYSTIFVVSSLYAAAYTGDVAKAEVLSTHLKLLHERGALLRYRPLANVMPLLPMALRGYSDLVKRHFAAVVEAHDPCASDAVINSQFYRAAAIIALSLEDFDAARDHITRAIHERRRSRSFHAWNALDGRVLELARSRTPILGPHAKPLRLLKHAPTSESPVLFGTVILGALQALPVGFEGGLHAFEERALDLLRRHFDCPSAELRDVPASIALGAPQLRVGSRFAVFFWASPGARSDCRTTFAHDSAGLVADQ